MYALNRPPFPLQSFTPLVYSAILEGVQTIQAPIEIVVASALTAISLACQDKFDIERNGIVSPPSLNILLAAESGERKSACDTAYQAGIRRYEAQELEAAKPRWAAYENKLLISTLKLKKKCHDIKICILNGQDTEEHETEMTAIRLAKPIEPKVPKILVSDTTSEALDMALLRWPSVGLISDEGDVIFSSGAMRSLGKLNQCWDGKPLRIDRKSSACFIVPRPRLTVSVMAQPALVNKFKGKNDQRARHIGMLARFLVAYPLSTQGYRLAQGEPPRPEHLPKFNERIFEICNKFNPDDLVEQNVAMLRLSPRALEAWQHFCNQIEIDLRDGEFLCDVKDSASKMGENAVRLAGLLHYFEGMEGDVSFETFERARIICAWYLMEFKQLFTVNPEIPENQQDAEKLEKYFCSHQFNLTPNGFVVEKNQLQKNGPNSLRGKKRLESALGLLNIHGKISFANLNKKQVIILNPNHFRPNLV